VLAVGSRGGDEAAADDAQQELEDYSQALAQSLLATGRGADVAASDGDLVLDEDDDRDLVLDEEGDLVIAEDELIDLYTTLDAPSSNAASRTRSMPKRVTWDPQLGSSCLVHTSGMGSAQQPNRASAESPPIRTLEGLLSLLSDEETAPTDLVACEFSGAMRSALEREGRRAISADWRECDIGGLHFCGDVRVILAAKQWERAYIFPPCSMTLRHDRDCIDFKIADGRAFWGIAFVLLCWTTVTA
jgi:hypothetical protein